MLAYRTPRGLARYIGGSGLAGGTPAYTLGDTTISHAAVLALCEERGTRKEERATLPHPSGDRHYSRRDPSLVKRGTDAPGAKLTEAQIVVLRAAVAAGVEPSIIAEALGVSRQTVWRHTRNI